MSLVEIIIILSIVAILAAIAFPNYSAYKRRAHRVEAQVALQRISQLQERFYATNHTYTNDLSLLGVDGNQSENGLYVLSVPTANALGFQAIAVPAPGSPQVKDLECQQFSIDHANTQVATPDPNGDCW